jgi:cytochrome c oxidase subunit 2
MRFSRFLVRVFPSLIAIVLLGGAAHLGCAWGLDGHQSTLVVDGPVARYQRYVFEVTLWVTLGIFVVVGSVLAYATIKFRARSRADEHAEPPPQGHGNPLVEMGLIVGSILLLVIIAVPTVKGIWYTHLVPEEYRDNLMTVRAVGYQWWFKFEYPDIQAQTAGADGVVRETPLVTGNELVVPVNTPIRVDLRTVDVIHSFWVPKLAGKVDMIPNRANYLWFKAERAGYYWGQCAEFCGESHGLMRFRVIVLEPDDWARWVERQTQLARIPSPETAAAHETPRIQLATFKRNAVPRFEGDMFAVWQELQEEPVAEDAALIARGRALFREKACIGCHTVRGHEGAGITGPDLTKFGSRTTVAASILDNTPENLKRWILEPDVVKPGNKMWHGGYVDAISKEPIITVDEDEAHALVAYLMSLR